MTLTLMSFGFRNGLPKADRILDARVLPNPPQTPLVTKLDGRNRTLRKFMRNRDPHLYDNLVTGLVHTAKTAEFTHPTLAVGCQFGRHRSVALVQEASEVLTSAGIDHVVVHRELTD